MSAARTAVAAPTFSTSTPAGTLTLEPVDLARDAALLHAWVTHPRAVYWQMQGASPDDVVAAYREIDDDPHHQAWLGRVDGVPTFLVETYDPSHSELAGRYDALPGDAGMHLLVAPPGPEPVHGLTAAVMTATMRFLFSRTTVHRVVVEPDERNDRIAAKNAAAGFVERARLPLRDKVARLSTVTREQFAASPLGRTP